MEPPRSFAIPVQASLGIQGVVGRPNLCGLIPTQSELDFPPNCSPSNRPLTVVILRCLQPWDYLAVSSMFAWTRISGLVTQVVTSTWWYSPMALGSLLRRAINRAQLWACNTTSMIEVGGHIYSCSSNFAAGGHIRAAPLGNLHSATHHLVTRPKDPSVDQP